VSYSDAASLRARSDYHGSCRNKPRRTLPLLLLLTTASTPSWSSTNSWSLSSILEVLFILWNHTLIPVWESSERENQAAFVGAPAYAVSRSWLFLLAMMVLIRERRILFAKQCMYRALCLVRRRFVGVILRTPSYLRSFAVVNTRGQQRSERSAAHIILRIRKQLGRWTVTTVVLSKQEGQTGNTERQTSSHPRWNASCLLSSYVVLFRPPSSLS
jgi:hypothetical protein